MNTPFCGKCRVYSIESKGHYTCPVCGDYCVKMNNSPLGTLANKETRNLRIQAHNAIDHIHANGIMSRKQLYKFLSYMYKKKPFHIGTLTNDELKDIITKFGINALDEIR